MTGRAAVVFAAVAALVAFLAVVGGFMVIGSPEHIRKERFDRVRSANLASLSYRISAYRRTHDALPGTLADISQRTTVSIPLTDPEGRAYGYAVTGTYTYELCADFDLPSATRSPGMVSSSVFTIHPAGHHCFQLEARPPTRD